MTFQHNFRSILDINPNESASTCIGRDNLLSASTRCRNSISSTDREIASRILDEMDSCSNVDMCLELLPELVSRCLCTNSHRSKPELCQIDQLHTEWKAAIEDHWSLVQGQHSNNSSERWGLRKTTDALNFARETCDEDADDEYFTERRNTFGTYKYLTSKINLWRSQSEEVSVPRVFDEYEMKPRRRTWPVLDTCSSTPELDLNFTTLFDPTPPESPALEVDISNEDEATYELWPPCCAPQIPKKSPLRAPNLSHLSFVSSISITSNASLPSTRQITPPILDFLASRPQTPADTTPPLPSPTPQSPHAIPWFLRDDFVVQPPDIPSRTNSGFRTSAAEDVEVEPEVCGVCRMAKGEGSCTCTWGDLLFSSDPESNASETSGSSGVKMSCFYIYRRRFKDSMNQVGKKIAGFVKRRRTVVGLEQARTRVGVRRWQTA